jgi:LysR family transcriptional activator of the allD operon
MAMLDPETLRTFVSVAETGSFSRAAEKLYKTTATISYRIKLLEDNTGVALFSRTTRSVLLTPAGMHLLAQAREWLGWIDSMPGELQQINDGVERQVNIVVNNLMYDPQAIARLLAWLTQRYPLRNFIFHDKSIWASGIRCCMMTSPGDWRDRHRTVSGKHGRLPTG